MDRNVLADLKSLFRFPFRGPDWTNRFIVGCALLVAGWVIPVIPVLFVSGYVVEVMRRVIRGEEPELPPWQDWGRLFVDGLRAAVVGVVYLLPGTVVWLGGFLLYLVGSFGMMPLAERQPPGEFFILFLVLFGVYFISLFVGSLLFLLGVIPLPAAITHFAAEERLGAAFQVRRWWTVLKERRWEYLIAWVLLFGLSGIMYFLLMMLYYSVCLCWLVPLVATPVSFYTALVAAALFGQWWRDYRIGGMESI